MNTHTQLPLWGPNTKPHIPCDVEDQETVARFWAKVDAVDANGCRRWTGAHSVKKYGVFYGGPRRPVHRATVPSHVFSWVLHNGPITTGLQVRHGCDVRDCVEITHLSLGTSADNHDDMLERHVSDSGAEGGGNSKLSWQESREICDLAWSKVFPQYKIAELYGIDQSLVSLIKSGKARSYGTVMV